MNEQTEVRPHTAQQPALKEHARDAQNDTDESHTQWAEGEKPDTKGYILRDSIHVTISKRHNYGDRERIEQCVQGVGMGHTARHKSELSGMMKLLFIFPDITVTQRLIFPVGKSNLNRSDLRGNILQWASVWIVKHFDSR